MQENRLLRYGRGQRVVHWLLAVAFLGLAATGLPLVFAPASPLAEGGTTRLLHRIFAVGFLAVPFLYAALDFRGLRQLVRESFSYDRDNLAWFKHFPAFFLGRDHGLPPQGRINAGQKLHHAMIIIGWVLMSGSGLMMWQGQGILGPGAFVAALWVHNVTLFVLLILTIGHIYFTFVYGALSAMTSGYVTRRYAEPKHSKWLADLDRSQKGGTNL